MSWEILTWKLRSGVEEENERVVEHNSIREVTRVVVGIKVSNYGCGDICSGRLTWTTILR